MQIEGNKFKKPGMFLGLIIALLAFLFVWQYMRREMAQQYSKTSQSQLLTVEAGEVGSALWRPQISAVGSIKAVQGTDLSAVIDGKIEKIFFVSGEMVEQGQALVQYENSNLQATVDQTLAAYQLSKIHYERLLKVYKASSAISREALDSAHATLLENKGAYENALALLQQATVVAPFSGKLGIGKVSLGQFVAKGAPIVSLQQIDPVYVDFSLAESAVSQIKIGDNIELKNSAYPDRIFRGHITATNSALNTSTRTLEVRAELPNPDHLLVPGMFADVNIVLPEDETVLIVPEMAVNYSPFGNSLFKIQGNKAQEVYITVGEQRGAYVAVKGNIKVGDRIVTSGVFKLQNGSLLRIVAPPQVAPDKQQDVDPKSKLILERQPEAIAPHKQVDEKAATNLPKITTLNLIQHNSSSVKVNSATQQPASHAGRKVE